MMDIETPSTFEFLVIFLQIQIFIYSGINSHEKQNKFLQVKATQGTVAIENTTDIMLFTNIKFVIAK